MCLMNGIDYIVKYILYCIIFRKLCKNKVEMDWKTACEGLTDFEKDFVNNISDYKSLVQKVHLLTLKTTLAKKANNELNAILNAVFRRGTEQIHKLQDIFIDQIVEDSGVGTSYTDKNADLFSTESEDENSIVQE